MTEPWLGHRDLCPIQWGESCDCEDPYQAEDEFFELQEENYQAGETSEENPDG